MLTILMLATGALGQLLFYPNDTLVPSSNLSAACLKAMNASIAACDPYIFQIAAADNYYTLDNATIQQSICNPRCGTELSQHRSSVATACAPDPMPWESVPATYLPDFVWAYYNATCLKDPSTGQWCIGQSRLLEN
jgi:hypothetical protein